MKNAFKIFLCLILVTGLCFSLTGCNYLDNERKNHAFWQGENIKLGDSEYIPLDECEYLNPEYEAMDDCIMVTEPDVPVLLSGFMGAEYSISKDGVFLFDFYDEEGFYYCRSDKYDEISERIKKGFKPDGYCYVYSEYDETSDYDLENKYYVLTQAEVNAVDSVISQVEPTVLPEIADVDYEYTISLDACSKDMLFKKYTYDLYLKGNTYYISYFDDESIYLFTVPEEYKSDFAKIMKAGIDSQKYWEDEYLFEDETEYEEEPLLDS